MGLAVWLPDRRNSEKPTTLRNLSSVASAPHCCNCVELTVTASGCASTSSTPVGRMEVRVAVTSRLCCTAAGTSVMESWIRSCLPGRRAGGESGCINYQSSAGGSDSREYETAVGLGGAAGFLSIRTQQNLRSSNHRTAAVLDHAADFLWRNAPRPQRSQQERDDRGSEKSKRYVGIHSGLVVYTV